MTPLRAENFPKLALILGLVLFLIVALYSCFSDHPLNRDGSYWLFDILENHERFTLPQTGFGRELTIIWQIPAKLVGLFSLEEETEINLTRTLFVLGYGLFPYLSFLALSYVFGKCLSKEVFYLLLAVLVFSYLPSYNFHVGTVAETILLGTVILVPLIYAKANNVLLIFLAAGFFLFKYSYDTHILIYPIVLVITCFKYWKWKEWSLAQSIVVFISAVMSGLVFLIFNLIPKVQSHDQHVSSTFLDSLLQWPGALTWLCLVPWLLVIQSISNLKLWRLLWKVVIFAVLGISFYQTITWDVDSLEIVSFHSRTWALPSFIGCILLMLQSRKTKLDSKSIVVALALGSLTASIGVFRVITDFRLATEEVRKIKREEISGCNLVEQNEYVTNNPTAWRWYISERMNWIIYQIVTGNTFRPESLSLINTRSACKKSSIHLYVNSKPLATVLLLRNRFDYSVLLASAQEHEFVANFQNKYSDHKATDDFFINSFIRLKIEDVKIGNRYRLHGFLGGSPLGGVLPKIRVSSRKKIIGEIELTKEALSEYTLPFTWEEGDEEFTLHFYNDEYNEFEDRNLQIGWFWLEE